MDMPARIHIVEEGPRNGFQIEHGPISTARKIERIDARSHTGLKQIQIVLFVNPKPVPGIVDAEAVGTGMQPVKCVSYTGSRLNKQGFEGARAAGRRDLKGAITLAASISSLKRNQNRTIEGRIEFQRLMTARYRELGVPVVHCGIMAAFGCVKTGGTLDRQRRQASPT